ncbi:MAG: hypothetical protein P8H57_05945 [Emcibacteraceae bacterium]|nr:hypothetical protein [Emcibacteraceae bacterium]
MMKSGFKWGIFRAYIPFLNMRIDWAFLAQGLVVSLSTGLALVPLLTASFGLTFEEAVTLAMLHMILVTSHIMVFGEPYAAGWITAALPLVLVTVLGDLADPAERFKMMTALSLEFSFLCLLMAVTGLGQKLIDSIPTALKAGIIFGAALAAFKRIFYDDFSNFELMPVSFISAIFLSIIIFYLPHFQKWKKQSKNIGFVASFGLLPVLIVVGFTGYLFDEFDFNIVNGFLNPPFNSLWNKASPIVIGWPSFSYYINAVPIVMMTYLLLFGDLLTGKSIVEEHQNERPDDIIEFNMNRSHYALAIRNFLMAVTVPFFPTQGVLWAGAQIIVADRWKEGKEKLDHFIGGISAFYYYAIPIGFLWLPIVTFLKPFMPVSLMLTLLITGIACSRLAFKTATQTIDRLIMIVLACFIAMNEIAVGIVIALTLPLIFGRIKAIRTKK